jgi:hypothetical protein
MAASISTTGVWIGPARRHVRIPDAPGMALFDGFPYLAIRVVPALYHIALLPGDASERDLVGLARAQWHANRLELCLVTGPESAWYIDASGLDGLDPRPPRGGALVTGRLKTPTAWPDDEDLLARQRRLASVVGDQARKGRYILGDLTKGGREASADDVARLTGAGADGVPHSLERCRTCGEWHGSCLDPSPHFFAKVMIVECRCANENRCAACGDLLYERKLNANYYEPGDGQIWHVPGFSGLDHRCPPENSNVSSTLGYLPELLGDKGAP